MSEFLRATKGMIQRHGKSVTFKRVSVPTYNRFSGAATSTETDTSVKAYARHVVANQYNMPNMIGREIVEFYFYAPDLSSVAPKINDKVVMNTIEYTVTTVVEHAALGAVVLYKVVGIKA